MPEIEGTSVAQILKFIKSKEEIIDFFKKSNESPITLDGAFPNRGSV